MALQKVGIERALLWVEPGPAVLVSTFDGSRNNVMTITWTLALDFAQHFALCTGPWNHSFRALMEQRECVVAVPSADMAETVVRIGDVSGLETDKFARFGLTALPAETVRAPLIGGCLADIECRVVDYVEDYGLVILHAERVWEEDAPADARMIHALGDGRFVADGAQMDLRHLMEDKLPPGL